jgi:phosphatidylserine/phosphatidylglycerophosphate/cardiolipin synthase-like enzyme
MNDPITAAVLIAAEKVPGDMLALGATAVESATAWSPTAAEHLIRASPASVYQEHTEAICETWEVLPHIPGIAVAAAIRAAAAAVASSRAVNQVSLVWTGPPSRAVGIRQTRAVVNTIVANATTSLLLVSFASYGVDDLAKALSKASDRGVDVSLILESHDDSGGGLTFDASKAFTVLLGRAHFYHWPHDARKAFFSSSARLHAKCIVADRSTALITSANLTGAGINDNIELGTLIEAGSLPATLHQHFLLLIEDGTLQLVR